MLRGTVDAALAPQEGTLGHVVRSFRHRHRVRGVAAVIFLEATLDLCLISAVFGGPIRGREVRAIYDRPDEIGRAA